MIPLFSVIGGPAAGKQTMLNILTANWVVGEPIGVGDLCRAEKQQNSRVWRAAKAHMDANRTTLWPDELVMEVLNEPFERAAREGAAIVLDGFLRTIEQNSLFLKLLHTYHIKDAVLIHVHADDHVCIARAGNRGRDDDGDIRRRLGDYHAYTVPAINAIMGTSSLFPLQRLNYNGNLPKQENFAYCKQFCSGLGLLFNLRRLEPEMSEADAVGR